MTPSFPTRHPSEYCSVLTSHHVVDGCSGVSVAPSFGEMALATDVVPFAEADLALLRTAVDPPGIAAFAEGPGSAVMGAGFLSGYPAQGMVSLSPLPCGRASGGERVCK